MAHLKEHIERIDDLRVVVEAFESKLLESPHNARVIALHGELGAGKTTFVQLLAKRLGVSDPVTSPTYVIEKIYSIDDPRFTHLVHIDAYRLDGSNELVALGIKEIFSNNDHLVLVEWAERVEDILPPDTIHIYLALKRGGKRSIEIHHNE